MPDMEKTMQNYTWVFKTFNDFVLVLVGFTAHQHNIDVITPNPCETKNPSFHCLSKVGQALYKVQHIIFQCYVFKTAKFYVLLDQICASFKHHKSTQLY